MYIANKVTRQLKKFINEMGKYVIEILVQLTDEKLANFFSHLK